MVATVSRGNWFAVRVRSNFERATAQSLNAREISCFLPIYKVRRQWSDRVKEVELPLFSGYVFCQVSGGRFLPLLETPGVVHVVGIGPRPVPLEDHEIDALFRISGSGQETMPWPYLAVGHHVRLRTGALKGVEGILSNVDGRHRVIVTIELLQRAVAVSVDRLDLEQVWPRS